MFDANTIQSQSDLQGVSTPELVAAYNRLTGKAVKKFASRAKGESQVFRAIQAARAAGQLSAKTKKSRPISATPRARKFCMPPRDEQNKPRQGSARSKAFDVVNAAQGGTFSEVMKATGWNERQAYEGIRLLNLHNGFGLWGEPLEGDNNDYLVRVVTRSEFERLAARQK